MAERSEKPKPVYVPESMRKLAEVHAAIEDVSVGMWIARAIMFYHQQQEGIHGPLVTRTERLIAGIVGKFSNPPSDDTTPISGV